MEARVAAICDKIKEHRDAGKTMSVRRVAVISAMIDDIAATDAEVMPARVSKRKARKGAARWCEEVSRLDESKNGVVVKSVHAGCDVGEILREACFMASCRGHPSVTVYRGVTRTPGGTEGDDSYSLVVDSVGPSLADVHRDYCAWPFKEGEVRRIMRQLLGGAKEMAEHGIVHRDIKPANIIFGNGGAVKISDFGASKYVGEKEPPSRFAGTNGYTAPEVLLENAEHGTLVDAWSLGCVMVELLTGKLPPFAGVDKADQLDKIFDVLGVPGRKALRALKPQVLADEVQKRRARQRLVGHRSKLRELLPEDILSQDGFEVLDGLLTVDPMKRLTAATALRCPWFTDNADDELALSTTVYKIAGVVTKSLSQVGQMAMSLAGRTLELLRPKAL